MHAFVPYLSGCLPRHVHGRLTGICFSARLMFSEQSALMLFQLSLPVTSFRLDDDGFVDGYHERKMIDAECVLDGAPVANVRQIVRHHGDAEVEASVGRRGGLMSRVHAW